MKLRRRPARGRRLLMAFYLSAVIAAAPD